MKDVQTTFEPIQDVRSLLGLWPDYDAVAADCKLTTDGVWQWVKRGFVPPKQNSNLVKGAESRGIKGVTYDVLAPLNVVPT